MSKKKNKNLDLLKVSLQNINVLKNEIAKKRDQLRLAVSDVNEILESLDETVDGLDAGSREFERAVDSMSQYL